MQWRISLFALIRWLLLIIRLPDIKRLRIELHFVFRLSNRILLGLLSQISIVISILISKIATLLILFCRSVRKKFPWVLRHIVIWQRVWCVPRLTPEWALSLPIHSTESLKALSPRIDEAHGWCPLPVNVSWFGVRNILLWSSYSFLSILLWIKSCPNKSICFRHDLKLFSHVRILIL